MACTASRSPASRAPRRLIALASALAVQAAGAQAAGDDASASGGNKSLERVVIAGSNHQLLGTADSAAEGIVTAQQLEHRPRLRAAEVLESVPGLVVAQHSGDGKANQYFLRGFNLDHGTDFATTVLGVPVNNVSHAHGQGYMDLNFLIPELVRQVSYSKGPYNAEDGDFATSGAAQIDYTRRVDQPWLDLTVGAHNYRRLLGAGSRPMDDWQALAAAELSTNDGPWDQPERLRRANMVLRLSRGTATQGLAFNLLAYDARWTASEHVPLRAITSGEIGRYGTLLPGDGGVTHRHAASVEWAGGESLLQRASAYVLDYGLNLFSAPSGFIKGPQGDQHEQADQRLTWGGRWTGNFALDAAQGQDITLGASWRHDRIASLGLYDTVARVRVNTVREDRVNQDETALWAQWRGRLTSTLRATLAWRIDALSARVTPLAGAFNMGNGGRASQVLGSPRVSIAWTPSRTLEFYANDGRGFHSNDARGVTSRFDPNDGSAAAPVPFAAVARSREVGLRATPLPGWTTSVSLWKMNMSGELVFVGDEGVSEPRGATRRHGVEWSHYITPREGWVVDLDLSWSAARFVQPDPDSGGRDVPNAIPLIASAGIAMDDGGPLFGGLRLRHLGAYALEPTGSQRSERSTVVNVKAGWRPNPQLELSLDVLNALNSQAYDVEYWGAACTRREGAGCNNGQGIDGRLVHPLETRTVRLSAKFSFR